MTDTMTLEALRAQLDASVDFQPGRTWRASLDAAIRERDELRSALSEMRELARDYERDRDKAEAELAALKKRIAAAPITTASSYFGTWCKIKEEGLPDEWNGKRVRLLVEDDDAQA